MEGKIGFSTGENFRQVSVSLNFFICKMMFVSHRFDGKGGIKWYIWEVFIKAPKYPCLLVPRFLMCLFGRLRGLSIWPQNTALVTAKTDGNGHVSVSLWNITHSEWSKSLYRGATKQSHGEAQVDINYSLQTAATWVSCLRSRTPASSDSNLREDPEQNHLKIVRRKYRDRGRDSR